MRIGEGAYVAAGSTITENVPPDSLGIARGRQSNKPGWASARRREVARVQRDGARPRPKRRAKRKKPQRRSKAPRKSKPRSRSTKRKPSTRRR